MEGHIPTDLLEYRGHVFSIGGQDESTGITIPNFLRKYNPKLEGMAMGVSKPLTKGKWLDGAVSEARVEDVPSQIDYLKNTSHSKYKNDINWEEDWKVLTMFIGANNLCGACSGDQRSDPAYFEAHMRAVLTQIEAEIPRVFVNLVTIFNISGVWYAGQTSEYCRILWHNITTHECYCLTTGVKADRDAMDIHGTAFNQIMADLAVEFAGHNNPNFTVVVQPGLSGINVAEFGEIYLSHLDCFHPSIFANQAFAFQIWNNMFTPVGQKQTAPNLKNITLVCPDENTFLQ